MAGDALKDDVIFFEDFDDVLHAYWLVGRN